MTQELVAGFAGDVVSVSIFAVGQRSMRNLDRQGLYRRYRCHFSSTAPRTATPCRTAASIGMAQDPGRVSGKRMAGHLDASCTRQSLEVVRVDETPVVAGQGAVRSRGGDVIVRPAVKGA